MPVAPKMTTRIAVLLLARDHHRSRRAEIVVPRV